jgi:dolichol-phosphate mannosyltransferase
VNRRIEISIVSPVYKAEEIIDLLVERLIAAIEKITTDYEIILVEDCGGDGSWKKILQNCSIHSQVKGIKLSRNYGQQYAIQAGLDASLGEYVITMDCDLQDLPEEISKLYNEAKQGSEIVVASRLDRQDEFFKRIFSSIFYKILSYLSETKQDRTVANFACYHRKAVDAMADINDFNRYYPMIQQLVGFRYTKVEVKHAPREIGKSSYTFSKRMKLAINTILSFSDKPLRLTVKLGVFLSLLSICVAITLVLVYFYGDIEVKGWASLALFVSFFSGVIISVLGMVGLYVGKTFESVKKRPTYIIQESKN